MKDETRALLEKATRVIKLLKHSWIAGMQSSLQVGHIMRCFM